MQGRGNQSYTLQVQYICPSMVTTAMPIFVQALRLKAGCFKASDSSALPSGVLAGTLASRMSINSPLALRKCDLMQNNPPFPQGGRGREKYFPPFWARCAKREPPPREKVVPKRPQAFRNYK